MIKKAFKSFEHIDDQLDVDLMEISVKQSQMVLTFYDELIVNMSDLEKLNKIGDKLKVTDITCFQDRLYVSMRNIKDIDSFGGSSYFIPFYQIITVLRDLICSCPALEYIISNEYIKVYIDLPNIRLSELYKIIDVFKQDPFIELSGDRPYLLFFNESLGIDQGEIE